VLQLFTIVLVSTPRILRGGMGLGKRQPPPHCEFWIQQRESTVVQLCLFELIFFSIVPVPFFHFQGGGSRNFAPSPIANFGFETTRMNCALIMLNCAAIPSTCAGPFFHEAITRVRILRNCTKIAALSLKIRGWFLQKILPDPKTCDVGV